MAELQLVENFCDNPTLRESFYDLITAVFGKIDFRTWHYYGWWPTHYRPFSLLEGDLMVANVCAAEMTVLIDGKEIPAIQIGAVATRPESRGKGLARRLMEHLMQRYEHIPFVFLFANETVLDFYPKFGFRPQPEVACHTTLDIPAGAPDALRLELANDSDRALIASRLNSRAIPTRLFGAIDFDWITAWHLINVYPNGIYYQEAHDVIWVVRQENDELHIADVVWQKPFDLPAALAGLVADRQINRIAWHFTPDILKFPFDEVVECDDSGLLVRGDFPIAGRQFKFPATAQT